MHLLPITADHWQAALQFPTEVALNRRETTAIRLQAARMVQAMLKVLLKEAKNRDELQHLTDKLPSTEAATIEPTPMKSPAKQPAEESPLPPTNESVVEVKAPVTSQVGANQVAVDQIDHASAQAGSQKEAEIAEAMALVDALMAAPSPDERTRYIGRVGPRKYRGKRKK